MTAASKPALDGSSPSMRNRPATETSNAKNSSGLTDGHTTLTAAATAMAAMADARNHAERDMGGSFILRDVPLEAVIGVEVHARLLTATNIFWGSPTTFGAAT